MTESLGFFGVIALFFINQGLVIYYFHLRIREAELRIKYIEDKEYQKWLLQVKETIYGERSQY